MLLSHMVCNSLVAGGRLLGVEQQVMQGNCATDSRTISLNPDAYECPKHVEQIINAIEHSVASSWFSSLRRSF